MTGAGKRGLVGALGVAEEESVEDEEQETQTDDNRAHTKEPPHQADEEAGDSQDGALK